MSQASPQPAAWKEVLGFQAYLQQCPRDQAPTRRPQRPPTPRPPLQIVPLVLGPRGPYPGSLGTGRSRGPAMSSRSRQSPSGGVKVPTSIPVPLGPAALQHLHSPAQRRAGSFRTSPLGQARMPTDSSPAGRRPAPAAAPRPQGNRREPMTDTGPSERDPPPTRSHRRTSSVGRTSVRQGGQSPKEFSL